MPVKSLWFWLILDTVSCFQRTGRPKEISCERMISKTKLKVVPRALLSSRFCPTNYLLSFNFFMASNFSNDSNCDSDPIFIDEQDNDSNDPTIAFKLQHDITFDKISRNEIPATPENLAHCVMIMPPDNLILIYTMFNGERILTSRSLKEWSKEHKNSPILEAVLHLPPSTRFDLKDMFIGFHPFPTTRKDISPILDIIRNGICAQNDDDFNNLLNHFAHMLQKPFERSNVTVLLYGTQGTGKGILYNLLAACLDPYAQQVQGFDKFHQYIKNFQSSTKLLVLRPCPLKKRSFYSSLFRTLKSKTSGKPLLSRVKRSINYRRLSLDWRRWSQTSAVK